MHSHSDTLGRFELWKLLYKNLISIFGLFNEILSLKLIYFYQYKKITKNIDIHHSDLPNVSLCIPKKKANASDIRGWGAWIPQQISTEGIYKIRPQIVKADIPLKVPFVVMIF